MSTSLKFLAVCLGALIACSSDSLSRYNNSRNSAYENALITNKNSSQSSLQTWNDEHIWPQQGGGPRHTGQSRLAGPRRLNLLWVKPVTSIRYGVEQSLVIDDQGAIFVIDYVSGAKNSGQTSVSRVIAIAHTGELLWEIELASYDKGGQIALSGDLVLVCVKGGLVALDKSGSIAWFKISSNSSVPQLAVTEDCMIYLLESVEFDQGQSNRAARLTLLNKAGEVQWQRDIENCLYPSVPAINSENEVYFASYDFIVHAFSAQGERMWLWEWNDPVAEEYAFDHALPEGATLVTIDDHILQAFGGRFIFDLLPDGTLFRAHDLGYKGAPANSRFELDYPWYIEQVAACASGEIYVVLCDMWQPGLFVIGSSGDILWRHPSALGAPLIDKDNFAYIGTAYGLTALSPDGEVLWRYVTTGENDFESSPVIGRNNVLYAISTNGKLYAFGL